MILIGITEKRRGLQSDSVSEKVRRIKLILIDPNDEKLFKQMLASLFKQPIASRFSLDHLLLNAGLSDVLYFLVKVVFIAAIQNVFK